MSKSFGIDTQRFVYNEIPTFYHVNLREPSGLLIASGFQMRHKDVMFIANAKVVDYYKLLEYSSTPPRPRSET